MRYEYLHTCDEYSSMEQVMADLEHVHGKWRQIKRSVADQYLLDKQGIVFAFRKL